MRFRLAAVLGTCALVLVSGCGSDLSPEVHPGRAAVVGDDEITIDEVDEHAAAYCTSSLPDLEQTGVALPMSVIRSEYVSVMTQESLARQYAEANDLDVRADVRTAVAQLDAQLADPQNAVEPDLRPALRDYGSRLAYANTVAGLVGQAAALSGDQTPTSQEQVIDLGKQVLAEWAAAEDIEIVVDPRFDLKGDGSTSLTEPVSDLAKWATTAQGNEADAKAYVAALPASQKCG